jgi:hypothetical protein
MHPSYKYHFENIPHLVEEEKDVDRYLRGFSALVSSLDDEVGVDDVIETMRGAVRFIADDAFRSGFESCHTNIVAPLRENTISRENALTQMRRHGERVRQVIVAKFEDAPGVPNSLTVEIEDVELPTPRLAQ